MFSRVVVTGEQSSWCHWKAKFTVSIRQSPRSQLSLSWNYRFRVESSPALPRSLSLDLKLLLWASVYSFIRSIKHYKDGMTWNSLGELFFRSRSGVDFLWDLELKKQKISEHFWRVKPNSYSLLTCMHLFPGQRWPSFCLVRDITPGPWEDE